MRMLADAAPLLRWFEIVRPGIVEQQEWAYVRAQRVVREERPDREAVAHPMLPVVAVTALNYLTPVYPLTDRKSVVSGTSVSVHCDIGGPRILKKNKQSIVRKR